MHQSEVNLFVEAITYLKDEFYIDAISAFKRLCREFPDSDLADDALYNVGLIYFHLNDLQQAVIYLNRVINEYPDSTISALDSASDFGRTAAKAYYSLVSCYIGMGEIAKAQACADKLQQYDDSYTVDESGNKNYFKDLAIQAINTFKQLAQQ